MIGPASWPRTAWSWRCSGSIRMTALDVGQEAEVQHLVGLVEHERVDPAEGDVALLGEVEQAGRRADDDVDALRRAASCAEARPPKIATTRTPRLAACVGQVLGDLDAELAGGHHDEGRGTSRGGRRPRRRPWRRALERRHEPLQERHAEPERLADAGAGLADDVLAREGEGEREPWMANVRTMPASASAETIGWTLASSANVGESSRTGARLAAGGASRSSGVSAEISGKSSVGTDRVIASRAQEPEPAHQLLWQLRHPGGRSRRSAARTRSCAAPGLPVGRGKAARGRWPDHTRTGF